MKRLLFKLGILLGHLPNFSLKRVLTYIYSGMVSTKIAKVGQGFVIERKLNQLVGGTFMSIGNSVKIGREATLTAWKIEGKANPKLCIGDNSHLGDYIHISASNGITIGNNVLTGRWVTIVDNSHGESDCKSLTIPPEKRPVISKGPVLIGNNVWIADKVSILPGVTIGDGCIIASNSVVTHSFQDNSVIGGVPARLLKQI